MKYDALSATDKNKERIQPKHVRPFRIREKNKCERVKEQLRVPGGHSVAGWVNQFPVLELNAEKFGVLIGSGLFKEKF
jgi:hypothetical protein